MDLSKVRGISLDLAETHSAIVFWRGDTYIGSDTIVANNRPDMEDSIIGLLSQHHSRSPVKWISAEASVVILNAKRHAEQNKILGVVEHWCRQHNVRFFEGITTQIDAASAIPHCKRKERKEHTRNIADRMFPKDHFNEDECDAIVTGIWGWGKFKELMWSEEGT